MFLYVMLGAAIVVIVLSIACSWQGIRRLKQGTESEMQRWFRRAIIFFALAVVCYLLPMIPLLGRSMGL